MSQLSSAIATTVTTSAPRWTRLHPALRKLLFILRYIVITSLAAVVLVWAAEAILRGSASGATSFLLAPAQPGLATVGLVALVLTGADAFMRRGFQSVLLVGPIVLSLAWVGREKLSYLGAPPYPTDFLYARQILELMPLMIAERPAAAVAIVVSIALGLALMLLLWRWSRRLPAMGWTGRVARLAVSLPVLAYFATHMDYASHSPLRSSLKISPKMWDQKANYAHNGLVLAFAFNLPMANVAAPAGYSHNAIAAINPVDPVYIPTRRPDIIMVMSESFWDPTRLPGTTLSPDPIEFTRSLQSGHVFSPEFGGMTANVEFEALTGFSNALLPYGSIPYQQYVRGEMPSLASFLRQEGYQTLAIHPFQSWFWNRRNVYEAFGFDRFLSEDAMEPLEKRGRLASDAALTERIIAEADASLDPIFVFSVTLQNHGPYEPGRYPDERIAVETTAGGSTPEAIRTFSEGMVDSDQALRRLIEWAQARERETIIVYFGDHLPPLGAHWVSTGFMDRNVSNRFGEPDALTRERETPLVIWSNRKGAAPKTGTISPAFLPLHTLQAARMTHPFYTGFLGTVHESWRVVDRHMLTDSDGNSTTEWTRTGMIDPLLRDYRLIQYDTMFGARHGAERFFPDEPGGHSWIAQPARQLLRPTG